MSQPTALEDRLDVLSFHVGHGDCTLVEYQREGQVAFRLLADAGEHLPAALHEYLRQHPRQAPAPDLDVVVLSHVDNDHQGGLAELLEQNFSIGEYLGPYLPTFHRLAWLFAPRVQRAVQRAQQLQELLIARHIPVIFPLEGYDATHAGGRITLSVISPARRLIRALSMARGGELANLLMRQPLPLEWLLDAPPADEEVDEPDTDIATLFTEGRTFLTTADLRTLRDAGLSDEVAKAAVKASVEPEFFGNSVLNDTSLVVVLDCHLNGTQRRRVLLTGDQENWSYIAARHPAGLGIDVLKAPHHGGSVYLHDKEVAFERVYTWLRPRTVFVSASGRYDLPRLAFRRTLTAVGASLMCPNQRSREPLTAGAAIDPAAASCFNAMGCRKPTRKPGVTRIELAAETELADSYACLQGSGHRGAAPIVVLEQHVISPSEAFVRWTRAELEKHANWLKGELSRLHAEFRLRAAQASNPRLFSLDQPAIPWASLSAAARSKRRYELVADPGPVIRFGAMHRLFWASRNEHYGRGKEDWCLYALPTSTQRRELKEWLLRVPTILVGLPEHTNLSADKSAIVNAADWTVLVGRIASQYHFPMDLVRIEILPELLEDIVNHFDAEISNLMHGWPSWQLLRLTNPHVTAPFPNLLNERWRKSVWGPLLQEETGLVWEALFAESDRSVLLPDAMRREKENWRVNAPWITRFSHGSDLHSLNTRDEEYFKHRFDSLRWSVAWRVDR